MRKQQEHARKTGLPVAPPGETQLAIKDKTENISSSQALALLTSVPAAHPTQASNANITAVGIPGYASGNQLFYMTVLIIF